MAVATRHPRVARALAARMPRVGRRPQHFFNIQAQPFSIVPFCIAPVLPGETLKNVLIQSRCVTEPLDPATRLLGWHAETYLFYVKHRDLDPAGGGDAAVASAMVLDSDTDVTSLRAASAAVIFHQYAGGMAWLGRSYNRIVSEYFRDQGEDFNVAVDSAGYPVARMTRPGVFGPYERLTLGSAKRTDSDNFDLVPAGGTNPLEFTERWQQWQALRDAGLMDMDYQDYVNTYGTDTRVVETNPNLHRPELLYSSAQWQYPSNIVEPTTGVPSVAVMWSLAERSDKAFAFSEPGFIVGLHVFRPKMYFGNPQGNAVSIMDDMYSWLPMVTNHNYEQGYKFFDDTPGPAGPLGATMTSDYWMDVRDIFTGGDFFRNYAVTVGTTPGYVALPTATGEKHYADRASVAKLFKSGVIGNVLCDGVAHLTIQGHQKRNPGNQVTI